MDNRAIGIFDSGIGGLTVLKELKKLLPNESIFYLGDTARVPYGIRSKETVTRYSFENANFLLSRGIKMLVVACNTASSLSLDALKEKIKIPIIGVIEPGVRAALKKTKNNRIGIIGTEATIRSNAYPTLIKKMNPETEVFSQACPLFVPLVEEGWLNDPVTLEIARRYLTPLKMNNIDTIILGCTHYPLLKDIIKMVMGDEINIIDSGVETAKEVKKILKELDIENNSNNVLHQIFVTDSPERFISVGERFLEEKIRNIEKITL